MAPIAASAPVIESLATLAYDGRRGAFFESELIEALKILQAGHVTLADFTGSWAGAIGAYPVHAVVVLDGGGGLGPATGGAISGATIRPMRWPRPPPIWPRHGWQQGLPWGMEVTLPADFP